jgi:hypothetical protein
MHHAKITDNISYPETSGTHKILFGIAAVAAVFSIAGLFTDTQQFYFSYLTSFTFYVSLALGCLFFVMIHYVTRSEYGVTLRRIPETFASHLFIFALLFIPIILGMKYLYLWTDPQVLATDKLIAYKQPYLNTPFFIARNIIYFAIWSFLGYKIYKNAIELDKTGNWAIDIRQRVVSAPGLLIFGFTVAFASFDWMMTLDPGWFSTMFGVYYFSMMFQAFFAFVILLVLYLHSKGLLQNTIRNVHLTDMSRLFFGFTVFYAYIAFSQYFLIYYANFPKEVLWFYNRFEGNWATVAWILLFGRFVIPFILLLPAKAKANMKLVGFSAGLIIVLHFIELYWIIMPTLHKSSISVHWLDLSIAIGMGALFLGLFFNKFRKNNMVSNNDPKLEASLSKH